MHFLSSATPSKRSQKTVLLLLKESYSLRMTRLTHPLQAGTGVRTRVRVEDCGWWLAAS